MSDRPRFTIELSIRDNYSGESWHRAIGCDDALSISTRDVDDMKAGVLGFYAAVPMEAVVRLIKTRELRREVLINTARQLAAQMADYMQDAEGWHDPDRVEPAKAALKRGR